MRKTAIIMAFLLTLFLAPAAVAAAPADLTFSGEVGYQFYRDDSNNDFIDGPVLGPQNHGPSFYRLDVAGRLSAETSFKICFSDYLGYFGAIFYRPSSFAAEFMLGGNYYELDKFTVLTSDLHNFGFEGIAISPTGLDKVQLSFFLNTENELSKMLNQITTGYQAGFGDLGLALWFMPGTAYYDSYTRYSLEAAVPLKSSTPVTALAGFEGSTRNGAKTSLKAGAKFALSGFDLFTEYATEPSRIGLGARKNFKDFEGSVKVTNSEYGTDQITEILTELKLKF